MTIKQFVYNRRLKRNPPSEIDKAMDEYSINFFEYLIAEESLLNKIKHTEVNGRINIKFK